jgi:hypothetical protein|tara:strand:- start:532 stop:1062 length:531 start_codon:yes stop_codon:yes gene_type:complete
MKINEILNTPKKLENTRSSATRYSAIQGEQTQDIVPQDIVPNHFEGTTPVDSKIESHPDHSAIAEGVSQIFRRQKGKKPTQGFRCTSGPRKGRIVAKPSTCFQKTDPVKSAKIRKKRQQKARTAGKKLAQTKRSGAGSKRLKGVQIKKKSMKGQSVAPRTKARPMVKSRVLKPKKR